LYWNSIATSIAAAFKDKNRHELKQKMELEFFLEKIYENKFGKKFSFKIIS
jgi:hypothetical protein